MDCASSKPAAHFWQLTRELLELQHTTQELSSVLGSANFQVTQVVSILQRFRAPEDACEVTRVEGLLQSLTEWVADEDSHLHASIQLIGEQLSTLSELSRNHQQNQNQTLFYSPSRMQLMGDEALQAYAMQLEALIQESGCECRVRFKVYSEPACFESC